MESFRETLVQWRLLQVTKNNNLRTISFGCLITMFGYTGNPDAQALLLSGRHTGLFTYIYTKGGKPLSVDVCLT